VIKSNYIREIVMVDTIKNIAKKASGVFNLVRLFGNEYWPAGVLNQLEVKYHLKPEHMLRLGYLRRRMAGRKNNYYSLFIYDRTAARDRRLSVRDIKDIYSSPDLLLFRGSISGDGSVHLGRVNNYENN
jgi:hypothetical protein